MGLNLIFGALSAVVSLFSGMAQANAAQQQAAAINRQADAMQQSAAAEREANQVQAAQQEVTSTESRRQKVREARIRRAQIIAASQNQGTDGSSGVTGAGGALQSNLGGMNSFSLGESKSNAGINSNLQRAADFNAQANLFGAQGQAAAARGQAQASMWGAIGSGISGFASIFD